MKKTLFTATLLSGIAFAFGPEDKPSAPLEQFKSKLDSLRIHFDSGFAEPNDSLPKPDASFAGRRDDLNKLDTILFGRLPEGLKDQIRRTGIDNLKGTDSLKIADFKLQRDSLLLTWQSKRNAQIANLPDSVKTKIQSRLSEISAKRAAVKAKIEAHKATRLQGKIEDSIHTP